MEVRYLPETQPVFDAYFTCSQVPLFFRTVSVTPVGITRSDLDEAVGFWRRLRLVVVFFLIVALAVATLADATGEASAAAATGPAVAAGRAPPTTTDRASSSAVPRSVRAIYSTFTRGCSAPRVPQNSRSPVLPSIPKDCACPSSTARGKATSRFEMSRLLNFMSGSS